MDAIRDMISKGTNKSKDNDDRSRTDQDSSSAYRSSDTSGDPDVGTKSYSRDTSVPRDAWDDRRQNDPNASSIGERGDNRYSGSSGLGGERTTSGYSGDSGRGNGDYGTSGGSGLSSGRQQSSKEYSRRSDNDNDDDDGIYSRNSSRVASAGIGDDETGTMGGGVYENRGMHGSANQSGRSSGMGTSGGNQSYGSYSSSDNNYD